MLSRFRRLGNRGFTLLETMIAMAIMLVAFSSILMVESASINTSAKTKQMIAVGMLAKNLMVETEFAIRGKKFEEIKTEEAGQFADDFQDYSWKREIKEVTLPDLSALLGGAKPDASKSESASDSGSSTSELLSKLITNFLSKAVREVVVTISWKRGGGTQSFAVSTYWVNLNHEFQLSL